MAHGDREIVRLETRDLPIDGGLVADEDRREPELSARRHRTLDHHGGAEIATHRVHGDLHG
jgi:hypothetical protein